MLDQSPATEPPAVPEPEVTAAAAGVTRSGRFRGYVEGVVSSALVAAAGLFLTPTHQPAVSVKISDSRSVVVAAKDVGGLRVLHGDREIQGPVIAVQLAIWNAGTGAARADAVLEQIQLVTNPPTPILAASIQKVTRPVTELSLETGALASGVVPLRFKILEQGDGAVVQLVYSGSPDVEVSARGILVGQREIKAILPDKPGEASIWARMGRVLVTGLFGLFLIGSVVEAVATFRRTKGRWPVRLMAALLKGEASPILLIILLGALVLVLGLPIAHFIGRLRGAAPSPFPV